MDGLTCILSPPYPPSVLFYPPTISILSDKQVLFLRVYEVEHDFWQGSLNSYLGYWQFHDLSRVGLKLQDRRILTVHADLTITIYIQNQYKLWDLQLEFMLWIFGKQ